MGRLSLFLLSSVIVGAQIAVFTDSYGPSRTNTNSQEKQLKPSNVNVQHFGKLASLSVDSSVYARPLIIPNVDIGGARRNVVYLATMANTVYAYDADDMARPKLYWRRNLGLPAPGDAWIGPDSVGILSTPYIDVASNTLYTVGKVDASGNDPEYWLYALDIRTGLSKYNSPQRLSFPFPDGSVVTSVPTAIQRAGMVMVGDVLVLAAAALPDLETQDGFLESFDARDLSQRLGVFQVTPTGLKGGIWQAGRGIAADGNGSIYVATAGGEFDGVTNFGSSVLKLDPRTLTIQSFFTPKNHDEIFHGNMDISANGVTLIPNTTLAFAGGKQGIVYLLDTQQMGGLESAKSAPLQQFQATNGCLDDCAQTLGTAFWSHPAVGGSDGTLFAWNKKDVLRAYAFRNQRFEPVAASISAVNIGMTSGPTVSWDGVDAATGIVWAVTIPSSDNTVQAPGTLRAFLASDVTKEIYNSNLNLARDMPGNFTKFAAPVVAGGKVFVTSQSGTVAVYGLVVEPPRKRQ